MMIGDRLREVRLSQQRSLGDVAEKAEISVATLSRIETNKQTLEVGLLLALAKILKVPAQELIAEADGAVEDEKLATKIAALAGPDRIRLWRDLAQSRRTRRPSRRGVPADLGQQVEELVAQIDYLREEIEGVRKRVRRRA
jgi:transcriptional regulator with XRE-family HTH domain